MLKCNLTLRWRRLLPLQEQRAWLAERMESRQPLPPTHARRALKALVHADAFERFLAAHFPASKVRPVDDVIIASVGPFPDSYIHDTRKCEWESMSASGKILPCTPPLFCEWKHSCIVVKQSKTPSAGY